MAEIVNGGQWTPRWWEPEVWPGSTFTFTATLHNYVDGAITGGAMFLDGLAVPVTVDQGRIQARVGEDLTPLIQPGGSARLYLDIPGVGRILWLNGTVSGGGN